MHLSSKRRKGHPSRSCHVAPRKKNATQSVAFFFFSSGLVNAQRRQVARQIVKTARKRDKSTEDSLQQKLNQQVITWKDPSKTSMSIFRDLKRSESWVNRNQDVPVSELMLQKGSVSELILQRNCSSRQAPGIKSKRNKKAPSPVMMKTWSTLDKTS